MVLISPAECERLPRVRAAIEGILDGDNPIGSVHYSNLRQSMKNGGGPACLRLRVVLTEEQCRRCHPSIFLNEPLYLTLTAWAQKHNRDRLHPDDLADPKLIQESRAALDELTKILNLGSLYDFQREGA